jgi:hypothetical protein
MVAPATTRDAPVVGNGDAQTQSVVHEIKFEPLLGLKWHESVTSRVVLSPLPPRLESQGGLGKRRLGKEDEPTSRSELLCGSGGDSSINGDMERHMTPEAAAAAAVAGTEPLYVARGLLTVTKDPRVSSFTLPYEISRVGLVLPPL